MAIEFNCPYCTAAVRVPDTAAGKNGRCPACQTLIRIPSVRPPVAAAEPPPPPPATAPTEKAMPPAGPFALTDDKPATPVSPFQVKAGPRPSTNYRRERQRRKSRALMQLLLPLLLLVAVAGGVVAYLYSTQLSFEGEVAGVRLAADTSFQTTLAPPAESVPWQTLFEQLQTAPLNRRSNLLEILFGTTGKELSVQIRPGTEAAFVRVPVLSHPDVARHVKKISPSLEAARQTEVDKTLGELEGSIAKTASGADSPLFAYRDLLTLNLFRGGLGRLCEAVVDGVSYPCVQEDAEGQLTFVVPRNVKSFTVRARADLPEKSLFPSPLALRITVAEDVKKAVEQPVQDEEAAPSEGPSTEPANPDSAEKPSPPAGEQGS